MKYKVMLLTTVIIVIALVIVHFFASRTLVFKEEVIINQSITDTWELLGNQFTEPHIWASNFKTSMPGGAPKLPDLAYRHRATTTENGDNWQELDEFDPANYSLSYHISKGVPSIAKRGLAHWRLAKINETQTRLNVDFILETKGLLGIIMSPIVSKKVGKASVEIVEEFKYYLENKKPHPRKLESLKN